MDQLFDFYIKNNKKQLKMMSYYIIKMMSTAHHLIGTLPLWGIISF